MLQRGKCGRGSLEAMVTNSLPLFYEFKPYDRRYRSPSCAAVRSHDIDQTKVYMGGEGEESYFKRFSFRYLLSSSGIATVPEFLDHISYDGRVKV
ncbi:hypothetical protein TNCV_3251961 [Trichonephila clavipes]|nr:hypothetical protein TNCV_3251961 [Trichonephila clavipes]